MTPDQWIERYRRACIYSQLKQPAFRKVSEQVQAEQTFPYKSMNSLLIQGASYDPCTMWLPFRWLRGIAGPGGV